MPDGRPLRALHLLGIDDTHQARVVHLSPNPARRRFDYVGNVELRGVLEGSGITLFTLVCGAVSSDRARLEDFDVIVNAVCDPDTNTEALAVVARIAADLRLPVVNHPERVLATARDRVAETLQGVAGAVVPRTVRVVPRYATDVEDLAAGAGIGLPFLVREAGTHGGTHLVLVREPADLRELDRFAFDGRAFYVTEFVDVSGADGLVRKYRTLVVGGEVFPKHLIVSDDWNVHANSRPFMAARPELAEEEERFVEGAVPDGFRTTFAAIHERLGLDYFGADHGIDAEGRVVLFEVNACFRPLAGSASESAIASHQASTTRLKQAVAGMVRRRAAAG